MHSIRRQLQQYKLSIGQNLQKSSVNLTKRNNTKNEKPTGNLQKCKQTIDFPYASHPAYKYINNNNVKKEQFSKFVQFLYHGLVYSVKNLKGPSEQYIKKKSVTLNESQQSITKNKKFLMLDLDQTLIHSIFDKNKPADVRIISQGNQFHFNMRPYCLKFLQNLSAYYQIYIFTASTKDYCQPIISYLNKTTKTISGYLHRKNCLETMNGFKIKDLRIITNRTLQNIIIVDNLVHSFGLQLHNGIPILDFIDNKQDNQLIKLQQILIQANNTTDVRQFIQQTINIRSCIDYDEKDFVNLQNWVQSSEKQNSHKISIKNNKKL